MKKKRIFQAVKNEKGFTLVELLIATLLMAIVVSAVGLFVMSVNRNYRRNQIEVELQYEAQTVMNQMKDIIIDSSKGISVLGSNAAGEIHIFVYYEDDYYEISWLKSEQSLYLNYYLKTQSPAAVFDPDTADIMSNMCVNFDVDVSNIEKRRMIVFDYSFANDQSATQTYNSSDTFHLRNYIPYGKDISQIYGG